MLRAQKAAAPGFAQLEGASSLLERLEDFKHPEHLFLAVEHCKDKMGSALALAWGLEQQETA